MKEGWSLKSVKDVSLVIAGQSPEGRFYNADKVGLPFYQGKKEFGERYIKPSGVWTSVTTKIAIAGDILMSVRAPVGPVNVSVEEICIGRGLAAIRQKENVIHDFLFYFFKYYESNIKGNTGAVFDSINKAQIENIPFLIPPLSDQQHIVSIIDKAFEAIDKAIENTQKNLQNAKELFESYLNNVFENGGDNWDAKRLGDVLVKTETVDPAKKPNQEFTYLDVSSVNKDTKEIENVTVLLGKDAPSRARKLIRTNDVIFATVRPTHIRVAVITREYNEQVCSTGYFVLRAKEFLSNNFVFYFLLTSGFNEQMEKLQKGASYPAVTDAEVKSIVIPFPSLKAQQTIVQKLEELKAESKNLESLYLQKLRDLGELKKSVLNKAFAGEL
jgi:type I restriction enzyme S subunit